MKKMDEHQQKSGDEVEEDDIFRKERPLTYRWSRYFEIFVF